VRKINNDRFYNNGEYKTMHSRQTNFIILVHVWH